MPADLNTGKVDKRTDIQLPDISPVVAESIKSPLSRILGRSESFQCPCSYEQP